MDPEGSTRHARSSHRPLPQDGEEGVEHLLHAASRRGRGMRAVELLIHAASRRWRGEAGVQLLLHAASRCRREGVWRR
ncbi:hypothetical protein QYE76_058882 [Lolium multiflorum]|uniref:Uncharacterized protein n=1 Tax=Lolium multiflorum TaxID=4521 RepID=A0AAD8T6B7_LOLMU|nr:hypothetical protein QYE76_058882 [Lolium multiflorum]